MSLATASIAPDSKSEKSFGDSQRADAGQGASAPTSAARIPGWIVPILRAPLVAKIVGANALVVAAIVSIAVATGWRPAGLGEVASWGAAVFFGLFVTATLVIIALRPLRALESTARRVWSGDLEARVPDSPMTDRDTARIGETLNMVLDGLISDRARMRALASAVISAGDEERARIEMTLHDSTAQSLAAISWELGALSRDANEASIKPRINRVKELTEQVLEDVRLLAHTVHPRVLDDLGLSAALAQLARQARELGGLDVMVKAESEASNGLAPAETAALYRVAQEALSNSMRHARPTTVFILLRKEGNATMLEVSDDGSGFDLLATEKRRHGTGLFTMQERVSLVGGTLDIDSAPSNGTRVRAHVPNPSQSSGSTA